MKIEKKNLKDNVEQLITEGIFNAEEVDVTTDKVVTLVWALIDYLQTQCKEKDEKIEQLEFNIEMMDVF